MFIASVIIPAHNRLEQLERAIKSIIDQDGSEHVEIIVVDDCSDKLLNPSMLRAQDKLIRNQTNLGAAVSRNVGIEYASGDWIYLLDSDDYILSANFNGLNELDNSKVYYSQLHSNTYRSNYPKVMTQENFFDYVLHRHPFMCQTSTLSFHKSLGVRFDESLPKHQDWDFILFQCLMKGISVEHGEGVRFFDRNDKNSISRSINYKKTDVWLKKLKDSDVSQLDIEYFQFYLQGGSSRYFSFSRYMLLLLKYLFARKMSIISALKISYKRVFGNF